MTKERLTSPGYWTLSTMLCCLSIIVNQAIGSLLENIIKCTLREDRIKWDKSIDLVMMAHRSTPQTSTGFTPNMLVMGKEMNMCVDLIYGSPNSRRKLHNYDCYCNYVEDLRNSMIDAYFRTRTCLGEAANRQKMCYDRDTTPHHSKKGD